MLNRKSLLALPFVAAAAPVFAAVPAEATASLSGATADIQTVGWAVFGVILAAMVFKYIRRAM